MTMRRLLALLLVLLAWPGAASAQICPATELVTRFGRWFPPARTELANGQRRSAVTLPTTSPHVAVRLLVEASSEPGAHWKIVLRDPKLRVLAILTAADFVGAPPGGTLRRWTGRLDERFVTAELIGGTAETRAGIVDGQGLPASGEGYKVYSIKGDVPNWQPLERATAELYLARGESVGMMMSGGQSPASDGILRRENWCCSGAMLTKDIYITNWHCGGTAAMPDNAYWVTNGACANGLVDLGWDGGSARRMYDCVKVLRVDKRLDYALLRVRPVLGPGAATGPATPVRIEEALPDDDKLFVVHHAECQPKLVSSLGCILKQKSRRAWTDPVTTKNGPEIAYECDTETGASGAPVFDSQGRMFALHHLGFEKASPANACAIPDTVNKGITMRAIMNDLRANAPEIAAEIANAAP